MKYRNTDKSTLNSIAIGGIVVGSTGDSLTLQYENLGKPRLWWYYHEIMIGKPKDNDSRIIVNLPNGTRAPLVGSLVTVCGVITTDYHSNSATILAEHIEDLTAYSKQQNKNKCGGNYGKKTIDGSRAEKTDTRAQ